MTKAKEGTKAKAATDAASVTGAPDVPGTPPGGDTNERPAVPVLHFKPLPMEVDKFQMGFKKFEADGDTIDVQYVRRWTKGEREGLEHACIECKEYPNGAPVLLPGNTQLWEAFGNMEAANEDFTKAVFRVTRVEAKIDPAKPDGPPKFVRFSIQKAAL